jgi:hypothetical protein
MDVVDVEDIARIMG